MDKIFENFTVTILKLNKLVQKIKLYEMQEYGLKAIHVMCGYYLNENPDGLTAHELVKLTLEDKAAISRAIRTLQEKGLAQYDLNGRNSLVKLTDEGRKLASFISERSEEAVQAGSAQFTEEQRIAFYQSLAFIAGNLESYYDGLIKKRKSNGNNKK